MGIVLPFTRDPQPVCRNRYILVSLDGRFSWDATKHVPLYSMMQNGRIYRIGDLVDFGAAREGDSGPLPRPEGVNFLPRLLRFVVETDDQPDGVV